MMRPSSLTVLRRYAPLLVVVAIQGLLVTVLPSTAADGGGSATGDADFESPYTASPTGPTSNGSDGADPGAVDGDPSLGTSGAAGSAGGTDGGGQAGQPGSQGAPGDMSHCVNGRQFDPAIDYFAPPCLARSDGRNPGATYAGVTADAIKLVAYYPQGNAAVDSALRAQGLYVSIEQERAWTAAIADFINSRYELYGRKVSIEVIQGQCSTIPPDTACLRSEMRRIAAEKKPFMFQWTTPLTSAPFDELSALGVLNFGGQMFMDSFSEARRPYHWDVHMSGTQIAQHFGQWWCRQMTGKPAAYSASPSVDGGPGNTNGTRRVLGIIGTNDPENIKMREEIDRILKGCGDRVAHTYDASNDLSTAAAQKSASVASMRQSPEATTVLCLCNPVGAQFVFNEMQNQAYYPETIYAGTVYTDLDDAGQSFMESSACPSQTSCTFARAFGLSSTEPRQPVGKDRAQRVWSATRRAGAPPYAGAELTWDYWQLMASLLQGAGPNLTPGTVEQGAFAVGFRGGGDSGHARRGFKPGVHSWNQDMAITYWNPARRSPFNGRPGSFITVGPRVEVGGYGPTLPPIPVQRT